MADVPVKFNRGSNTVPGSQGDIQLTHRFTVQIAGVTENGIVAVEGLGSENEVVDYQHSEEGYSRARAGRLKYKPVTLTREYAGDTSFYDWRDAVVTGKTDRRSVSIICLSDSGAPTVQFDLFNAWPLSWQGPDFNSKSSGHALEK